MSTVGSLRRSYSKTMRRSLGLGSIVGLLFLAGCLNADMNFSELNASATSNFATLPKLVLSKDYTVSSKTLSVGSVLSPSPQAYFTDSNGNLLSTQTDTIELFAYLDTQCFVPVESSGSIASVVPTLGVSTFNGLSTTHAGTVYLLASSTLSSGDKVRSACSKAITFNPGVAHHIVPLEAVSQSFGNNGNSSSFVKALHGSVGASLLLRAQVVDSYGNAVVPSRPTSITFSGFSGNLVGIASSLVSVDSQGLASLSIVPGATMMPWGVYTVAASGDVSSSYLQPVELVGASTATQVFLDWFPVRIFDSDPQYIRMTPKDLHGVPIPTYSSSVQLSPNFGVTQSAVPFSSEGGGVAYSTLAVTGTHGLAVSGVSAFLSGVSGINGTLALAPFLTSADTDCQGPLGPSTAVGAASDWSSGSGWLTAGSPTVPTLSNRAVIPIGFAKSLSSNVSVGCVQLEGALQFDYGKVLEVRRSEFLMGAGGSLVGVASPSGSSKYLKFTRTDSEGPGAQRLVLPPGGSVTLTELQVQPNLLAPLDGYAFFINGSTSSLVVDRFWSFMNTTYFSQAGQYYPYRVYINTNMTVNDKLTVEYGAEVIVNPGAKLTLSNGAYLLGKLTVRAGGTLLVGAGQELTVYDKGGLTLDGIGPLDSRSVTSGLAVVKSSSGGRFAIHAYSGATLNLSHFYISGLGSGQASNGATVYLGLSLDGGVKVQTLNRGLFENFDPASPVITLGSTLNFSVNHFFDLHFLDHNGTISASSGNLINASALTLPFGIVQSTIVGPNNRSLKDYVSSPAGLLFWSY